MMTAAGRQEAFKYLVDRVVGPFAGVGPDLGISDRRTGELAYYRCCPPAPVPLTVLVGVAGPRRRVEEFFQPGKGLAALVAHQARSQAGRHRRRATPA